MNRSIMSKMDMVKELPVHKRVKFFNALSPEAALALKHDITFIGRPQQQYPSGDFDTWLILSGRGWGKTFVGSHTVIKWAKDHPGCKIALIGSTSKDCRDVMIKGQSGILKQSHPEFMPIYNPSNSTLTWPNGSTGHTYSGETPDALRGPQHHFALVDELAKMMYQDELWDQLQMTMRLGEHPRVVVTTTPRPTPLIKKLAKDPTSYVTTGQSYDNNNLPKKTLEKWHKMYDGTRTGRQEMSGEILEDNPNGLFNQDNIDHNRISTADAPKLYDQIVVAVDPSVSNNANSDSAGLAVTASRDDHGYLLNDSTMVASPNTWVQKAIDLYYEYNADAIVYEKNQGGIMTEQMINNVDKNIKVYGVHAHKAKQARAEPVSALAEQNRIHHVGNFELLEKEICDFDPTLNQKSPNRLDAYVYGFSHLFKLGQVESTIWQL